MTRVVGRCAGGRLGSPLTVGFDARAQLGVREERQRIRQPLQPGRVEPLLGFRTVARQETRDFVRFRELHGPAERVADHRANKQAADAMTYPTVGLIGRRDAAERCQEDGPRISANHRECPHLLTAARSPNLAAAYTLTQTAVACDPHGSEDTRNFFTPTSYANRR